MLRDPDLNRSSKKHDPQETQGQLHSQDAMKLKVSIGATVIWLGGSCLGCGRPRFDM